MCGVFGVVLPGGEPTDAASIAALGLFALQHRGQESAGLAVSDGEQLMLYKDLGMISNVLDERRLPSLRGQLAIAHCRYSTTGSTICPPLTLTVVVPLARKMVPLFGSAVTFTESCDAA